MYYPKLLSLVLCLFSLAVSTIAQHTDEPHHSEEQEPDKFRRHRIGFLTGYTWVRKGDAHEKNNVVMVPTFGFDYSYFIKHNFVIGLHNDVEIGKYLVETGEEESIVRENAFVSTLVLIVEPLKGWGVYAGAGIELEHHENMWVVRFGTEYVWLLPKDWDIVLGVAWDVKKEFDSIGFGLTIGKRLGKPK